MKCVIHNEEFEEKGRADGQYCCGSCKDTLLILLGKKAPSCFTDSEYVTRKSIFSWNE